MNTEKRKEKVERIMGKAKFPEITKQDYSISLIRVMNWHNQNSDERTLKKGLIAWLKESGKPEFVPSVEAAHDSKVKQVAILALHKSKGDYLSEKHDSFIEQELTRIKNSYFAPVAPIVPVIVKEAKLVDRVMEQAREIAGSIDEELDLMWTKKSTGNFSIETLLKTQKATEAVSRKIASFYTNILEELSGWKEGDAELVEAYSCYTKPHVKRVMAFLEGVVNACNQNAISLKAQKVRKPRAKKTKSASSIVSKLQYLKECPTLKVKSIAPTELVGAKQLFAYNTKYKRLTKYVADSSEGLTVKGTTIIGFSLADSEVKTVRNPEQIFAEVSKKALSFHLKKMKTKSGEVNGRINEHTLLLTV